MLLCFEYSSLLIQVTMAAITVQASDDRRAEKNHHPSQLSIAPVKLAFKMSMQFQDKKFTTEVRILEPSFEQLPPKNKLHI